VCSARNSTEQIFNVEIAENDAGEAGKKYVAMINTLSKKQRPLMTAGVVSFACFLVTLLSIIDGTQILGIDRWIKPMKFYISIAIFVWTIAVLLQYLPNKERFSWITSWTMIVVFAVEMAAVTGQAIRGTTSHFNIASPLDGAIFSIMGVAIVVNTIFVGVLAYYYFKLTIDLPPAVLWGVRLGLLLFLFGSIEGGYMSAQLGHTVGAVDGGPGLSLTNWSTIAGDLRVAHFLGLHSLQAVPIVGLLLERFRVSGRTALTAGFALVYFVAFMFLFIQAMAGQPFLSM
jgi:hypothetical protein